MTAPSLVVPAYFDPIREAAEWSQVTARASAVRLVVLNPSNGPGPGRQGSYADLTDQLRATGIRRIGYVNTDYGTRPPGEVHDDCKAFRDWYDVDGVFLDQVTSDVAGLDAYERYVRDARSLGCRKVVLNPGVYPHRAYFDLANLVVTFDGNLEMHRTLQVPDWATSLAPQRFCHLVYGVPESEIGDVRRRAASSHAGALYITDGLAPNPWGGLAGYWEKLVGRP
ncbi:MAG: spherulation-specific family 4 protein [Dermatophilaceae bacterium]|nr:spherulation-specific family 4 protein [Dermatophilaceae bacterium]